MRSPTALLVTFALAAPLAAQTTWTVGSCGVSADFSTVQQAVDAASDGDTIVACNNLGSEAMVKIIGKSLTVVGIGNPELGLPGQPSVRTRIAGLSADQRVVFRGFHGDGGLIVSDCDGPVWIEDCDFNAGGSKTRPGLEVLDAAAVTVVDSTFRGARSLAGVTIARPGLLMEDAQVQAFGSTFRGGHGNSFSTDDGAPGVEVRGSGQLVLDGSSAEGGAGGDTDAPSCVGVGDGGHAVLLDSIHASFWHVDSQLLPGFDGTSTSVPGGCPPSQPDALTGPGLIHVHDLGGPSRGVRLDALLGNGETGTLELERQPTDDTLLLIGLDHVPVAVPGLDGVVLPGGALSVVPLGTALPASLPVTLGPAAIPAGLALPVHLQLFVLTDQGDKRVGRGTATTLHGGL